MRSQYSHANHEPTTQVELILNQRLDARMSSPDVSPRCPHCRLGPLYVRKGIRSGGFLGPELLPGLGVLAGNLNVVACGKCGFLQFFVSRSYRKRLAETWPVLENEG